MRHQHDLPEPHPRSTLSHSPRLPRPLPAAAATGDNQAIEATVEDSSSAKPSPPKRRHAVSWLLGPENPSGAVYGVIVIGALLAGESGRHETYLDTFSSATVAAALYWLAHAYAGLLGRRLSAGERLTLSALAQALWRDLAVIRGAAVPLLALAVSAGLGAGQQTAVTAALWSAVASLVGLELIAGLRSGARPRELLLEVSVGMAMGLAILALKVLLH